MLIFLQTGSALRTLEVEPSMQVSALLTDLSEAALSFGGRPLRSELTLGDYGVMSGSTLEAAESLEGGKKKKKAYTTPKKKKHAHKKEKLAVLKIYKVDSAQKVTRARRPCQVCGSGVFMAKHKTRFYCGKCHVTVAFKS